MAGNLLPERITTMRSNTKQVREQVLAHILDDITVGEVKANLWAGHGHERTNVYHKAYDLVTDGEWLVYDQDKESFLNSLGINPNNKTYPVDKVRHMYAHLIASEISKWDFSDYEGVK